MTYLDTLLLDLVERSCRGFQRLTGRTNVWLAVQLTNISIIVYFVWAGVSFWVSALESVLGALVAAGESAGVRPAVTGPAGAGALYACLDPDTPVPAVARFVSALREQVAGLDAGAPRGSVAVLAGPPPALAAAGAYRDVPGAALMRAVRDQFDPEHRMFPGRFTFAGGD